MTHRARATLVALMTLGALAAAACGGGSTAPALTDPKEILVKSVETTQKAKSVHLRLDVSGKLALGDLGGLFGGLPGSSSAPTASPGSGGSIDVTGTSAEGDVDVARGRVRIGFTAPSLLNLTGEIIAVDQEAYLKVSLLGDKYQKLGGSGATSPSPSPTDPAAMLDDLRTQIDKLKTPPTKLADEKCGDTDCYHVQVKLDSTDAAPLASLAPGMTGTGTLDVWVRKNDLRPSQLVLVADAGTSGNLKLTVTLSGWDSSVDIQAPPADQVSEGSFGLPSLAP